MSKYDDDDDSVVRDGGAVHVPLVAIDGTMAHAQTTSAFAPESA